MKRRIAAFFVCFAFSIAILDAHVVVTPRESAAGAEQVYTVRVPTEGTVSSMSLELEIPAGMHVMQVASGEGFTFDVKKDGNRIVAITWKRDDGLEWPVVAAQRGGEPHCVRVIRDRCQAGRQLGTARMRRQ